MNFCFVTSFPCFHRDGDLFVRHRGTPYPQLRESFKQANILWPDQRAFQYRDSRSGNSSDGASLNRSRSSSGLITMDGITSEGTEVSTQREIKRGEESRFRLRRSHEGVGVREDDEADLQEEDEGEGDEEEEGSNDGGEWWEPHGNGHDCVRRVNQFVQVIDLFANFLVSPLPRKHLPSAFKIFHGSSLNLSWRFFKSLMEAH